MLYSMQFRHLNFQLKPPVPCVHSQHSMKKFPLYQDTKACYANAFLVLFILAVITLLNGCGDSSSGEDLLLPEVFIECENILSGSGCSSSSSKTVYVGFTQSLNDCTDVIEPISSATEFQQSFVASNTSSLTDGTGRIEAEITSWVDESGFTISQSSVSLRVCAFIDTNSNATVDTNESIAVGTLFTGQAQITLDEWDTYTP